MAEKTIRSRILEFFEPSLLKAIDKVCRSSIHSDNNQKVDIILNLLRQYNKDFVELGPGTNRLAILIDNYVFKIAMDKWGVQDNWNEFTMTQELQPYVIKVYESNGLIAVTEYVTLISREEFMDKKPAIFAVLDELGTGYLMGDVGYIPKNYLNWGYRDDGTLVILDFAYIYRITGDEFVCSKCNGILEYDENYTSLRCSNAKCGRKYSFMDIRRRISLEDERKENFIAKQLAYKMTRPIEVVEEKEFGEMTRPTQKTYIEERDETVMGKKDKDRYFDEEAMEQEYLDTLVYFKSMKENPEPPDDGLLAPVVQPHPRVACDDTEDDDEGIDKSFFMGKGSDEDTSDDEDDDTCTCKGDHHSYADNTYPEYEQRTEVTSESSTQESPSQYIGVDTASTEGTNDFSASIEVRVGTHEDSKELLASIEVATDTTEEPIVGMAKISADNDDEDGSDTECEVTHQEGTSTTFIMNPTEEKTAEPEIHYPAVEEKKSSLRVYAAGDVGCTNTPIDADAIRDALREDVEGSSEDEGTDSTPTDDEYEDYYEDMDREKSRRPDKMRRD